MTKRVLLVSAFFLSFVNDSHSLEVCPFQGKIDLLNKKVSVTLGSNPHSSVSFYVELPAEKKYQLSLVLEHLKTSVFEISTQLESSLRLENHYDQKEPVWLGKIFSQYSLLNYKPISEITGDFEIRNQTLYFPAVLLGSVKMNGFLELYPPYKLNVSFILNEIPMKDFLSVWVQDPALRAQGLVSGRIQISGQPQRLNLSGYLSTYQGIVEELEYDSIVLNMEGQYPIVTLSDSVIAQSDGMTFNIEGNFDLSNKDHFESQIAALTKSPLVSQEQDQYEWTIRRRSTHDESTSEFKSFLREEETNDNPLKEDPDLLGVEQEIRF